MKAIQTWLDEYAVCHQNPTNKMIHWVCVPLILWSLLALLWLIPLPVFKDWPVPMNLATLAILVITVYYLLLSWQLALGILLLAAIMLWLGSELTMLLGLSLGWLAMLVFVLAWVGQFIGHHHEGKRPALFEDLRYLLIGPLWCMAHLYKKLAWKY